MVYLTTWIFTDQSQQQSCLYMTFSIRCLGQHYSEFIHLLVPICFIETYRPGEPALTEQQQ